MRLVATDLDGTLLRPDGSLSGRSVRVLRRAVAEGVDVVFVTGRPARWMADVAAATDHRGTALCSNGAAEVDLDRLRVVRSRAFRHRDLLRTVQIVREIVGDDARFAFESAHGPRWETGYPAREVLVPAPPTGSVAELLAGRPRVLKVLCRSGVLAADEMLRQARSGLRGLAEPVHSNTSDGLLEVGPLGVSKASALAAHTVASGIHPSDVVAFGDMPNDVAMLRWAGISYAMADGHPEALAAADRLAPPSTVDGVAQVLEGLLDARAAAGAGVLR